MHLQSKPGFVLSLQAIDHLFVTLLLSLQPWLYQLENAQVDAQTDEPKGQFPNSDPARHFLEAVHAAVERVATTLYLSMCAGESQKRVFLGGVEHRHEVGTLLACVELVPAARVTNGVIKDIASNVLHARLSFDSVSVSAHARIGRPAWDAGLSSVRAGHDRAAGAASPRVTAFSTRELDVEVVLPLLRNPYVVLARGHQGQMPKETRNQSRSRGRPGEASPFSPHR
jgi:hypothetical protein